MTESDRAAMFEALTAASTKIPSVRQFRIGRRITLGTQYEKMMRDDYPYFAIVEFDDRAGLQAYLAHPDHEKLGELFYQLLDGALVYDYESASERKEFPRESS